MYRFLIFALVLSGCASSEEKAAQAALEEAVKMEVRGDLHGAMRAYILVSGLHEGTKAADVAAKRLEAVTQLQHSVK